MNSRIVSVLIPSMTLVPNKVSGIYKVGAQEIINILSELWPIPHKRGFFKSGVYTDHFHFDLLH